MSSFLRYVYRSWPIVALFGLLVYTLFHGNEIPIETDSTGCLFIFVLLTFGLTAIKLLFSPSGWRLLRRQIRGDPETQTMFVIKSSLPLAFGGEVIILNFSNGWARLLGIILIGCSVLSLFTALLGGEELPGGKTIYRYCPFCKADVSVDVIPTAETPFSCPNHKCGKILLPAQLVVKVVPPPKTLG